MLTSDVNDLFIQLNIEKSNENKSNYLYDYEQELFIEG